MTLIHFLAVLLVQYFLCAFKALGIYSTFVSFAFVLEFLRVP